MRLWCGSFRRVVAGVVFLSGLAVSPLSDAHAASSAPTSLNGSSSSHGVCASARKKILKLYSQRAQLATRRKSTNRVDQKLADATASYGSRCATTTGTYCTALYQPVCGSTKTNLCTDTGSLTCIDSYALAVHTYPNLCELVRAGATFLMDGDCFGE